MWTTNRTTKAAALILAALTCTGFTAGCSQKSSEAPIPTEQIVSQESISTFVEISGVQYDETTESVNVRDIDITDLEKMLTHLPHLHQVTLDGMIPEISQLRMLKAQYPEISLIFPVSFGEKTYTTDAKILDLSNTDVTPEALGSYLPLFDNLEELSLTETGLSEDELMKLANNFPDILVRCELPLAGQRFLTDLTEIDISGCTVTEDEIDRMLPYFPRLEKLDMSFCGIADEEMDALNQRHPEVSIVWTLKIGEAKTRTDAIYFYPAEVNYYPTNAEMEKLRYCHDLIAVDIGHTRATDCEFLWHTPKVKYLILADTGITDITPVGNLNDLIYLELFNLKIDDYSPLLNCKKLQDLNIGTTYADPAPLAQMTWLHNLQWHRSDQNPETKEDVLKLPEQLPDTNVVLFPKKKARNIGGPWRYIPNYYVFRDIIGATYFNQDQIADYWGEEDAARIMACESGKSFCAYTLAEIVKERMEKNEPIIGLKNVSSEKAQILYDSLLNAEP